MLADQPIEEQVAVLWRCDFGIDEIADHFDCPVEDIKKIVWGDHLDGMIRRIQRVRRLFKIKPREIAKHFGVNGATVTAYCTQARYQGDKIK